MLNYNPSKGYQKGLIPFATLLILRTADNHGYAIINILKENGFEGVQGGMLYPLMKELSNQGIITSHWQPSDTGPVKKIYRLTPAGIELVSQMERDFWDQTNKLKNIGLGRS